MLHEKWCRQCGERFITKRYEAEFCSNKCAAAWAREQGYHRDRFHAEKPEWIKKNCEWCNTIFEYNEYALRGGQRVPKFCSNKCRQAAYRARKEAEGVSAGKTHHWDDGRNDKTETNKGTQQENKGSDKKHDKGTSQGKREYTYQQGDFSKGTSRETPNKGTSQKSDNKGTQQPPLEKRWQSTDPYEILGVLRTSSFETIKKQWKKLLRTYHPDVSNESNAERIAKKINWAWDKIEKPSGWRGR